MTDDENDRPENGSDVGTSTRAGPSLSLDEVLDLLSDRQRRELLAFLRDEAEQTATLDETVEQLVARNAEQVGSQPDHDHVARSLHHVHLPKLGEAGVVEYDARSGTVRYRPDSRLETWLERIRSADEKSPSA